MEEAYLLMLEIIKPLCYFKSGIALMISSIRR